MDRRTTAGPTHNYLSKLAELVGLGRILPGSVHMAEVRHDDWCGIFAGQRCDCDPDILLRGVRLSTSSERN